MDRSGAERESMWVEQALVIRLSLEERVLVLIVVQSVSRYELRRLRLVHAGLRIRVLNLRGLSRLDVAKGALVMSILLLS